MLIANLIMIMQMDVTLHVFEICDGASLSSCVHNINSVEELKVSIKRTGENISIKADIENKPWSILFRDIFKVEEVKNATYIVEDIRN